MDTLRDRQRLEELWRFFEFKFWKYGANGI